jgi:phage terminase small subunit
MDALPNVKQEKFAQHVASGKSLTEAYKLAGYAGDGSNASTLSRQEQVAARITQIEGYAAAAASCTKERIVSELMKMAFAEVEPIKDSTKAKALETLAKIGGLTNDRLQVDVTVSLADLVNGSFKLEPPTIEAKAITDATNEQENTSNINDADIVG